VRSWAAQEEWLPWADFSNQLHSPPYAPLLNCDSWQVGWALVVAQDAVLVCFVIVPEHWGKVVAEASSLRTASPDRSTSCFPAFQPASQLVFPSSRHTNKAVCAIAVKSAAQRQQTFTWCLERVLQGPLANVWLTVGVRVGDYANV
jgi:hypothetical protein